MQIEINEPYELPYCVYGHFADGRLVYIGSGDLCRAFNITKRKKHHIDALRGRAVKVVIFNRFAERQDALNVENIMIRSTLPIANIYGAGKVVRPPRTERVVKGQSARVERTHRLRKQSDIVMNVLIDAAEKNEPCPSNADIAEHIGSRPVQVSRIISSLAKRGHLSMDLVATGRVIHINGFSTQPTADYNAKGVATKPRQKRAVDRIII